MSEDTQLIPVHRAETALEPTGMDTGGRLMETPTQKMRRLLRGRLHWAILLAVLLGAAGAGVGYLTPMPVYQCVGLVQVSPTIPKPFGGGVGEPPVMPMYDQYMRAQASRITSSRLISLAMDSGTWGAVAPRSSNRNQNEFTRALEVTVKGQVLQITFQDGNPDAARAGIQSVVEAYRKVYQEDDGQAGELAENKLEERRRQLEVERNRVRNLVSEEKRRQAIDDMDAAYEQARVKLARYQLLLDDVMLKLASIVPDAAPATMPATSPALAAGTTQPAGATTRPSLDRLATSDPIAKALLAERNQLERQIDAASVTYGELHPVRQRLEAERLNLQQRVTDFMETAPPLPERAADRADPAARTLSPIEIAELQGRGRYLQDQVIEAEKIARQRATAALNIRQWREEEADLDKKLLDVQDRIQLERLQRTVSGRLAILSSGEGLAEVVRDRRLPMGVMGALGGSSMAFAIVMLIGAFDRRWRSPDDARTHMSGTMMLGILPNLPDDLGDPDQAAAASHAVHHIRSLLQIRAGTDQSQSLAITSPAPGTGKTSLALALGVSFASASSRTLLIDCDVASGGLTSRVRAIVRRKIGQVLHRQGLISPAQLDEALERSKSAARPIGEVLVELGYVKPEDVQGALLLQQQNRVGLLDALSGEDLTACIADSGIANLYILPLGAATARHASRLSPAALQRLIAQAKSQFDIVLLDTGPVPGSLEASQLAAEVDGVVLVVARGEDRTEAENCLQALNDVQARIAGVVFNRANLADVVLQSSGMRSPATGFEPEFGGGFGPMASALAKDDRNNQTGSNL